MSVNLSVVKCISKIFKIVSPTTDCGILLPRVVLLSRKTLRYSTVVQKQLFDMFDIFTDVLFVNRSSDLKRLNTLTVIECVQQNRTKVHKIDQLVANLDISNLQVAVKTLVHELQANIELRDWDGVDRILLFFIDKKVSLSHEVISKLTEEFCNFGFVVGLKSLLLLTDNTNDYRVIRGKVLHDLAECYWRIGNVRECLAVLRDYCERYPNEIDSLRKLLRVIIYLSVSSHCEAVLFNVAEFVREFTEKYDDHYFIIILWNDLFISEWHSDNQLADTLLDNYEKLRTSVTMMASTLARNFMQKNRFKDVHRLLEVLLKHDMKSSYATVTRMLYNYYSMKGDKFMCSEIIKSSVILNIPLREEQYNSFISWSVSGNPYKFVKPVEINGIHSNT